MDKYLSKFKDCLQNEAAFCTAVCPFHLNTRDFVEKIGRGNYNAAFKTLRNAVGFPRIVAALCHAPCWDACPRKSVDNAIELNILEKACVQYATKLDPNDYNVPIKGKKIAIIGAGISGLACTLRLSAKKYALTVYERTARIGGRLWDELPEEIFMSDIAQQFKYEKYALHLNTEIVNLEELQDYAAIYVATGEGGLNYGLLNVKGNATLLGGRNAVFAGGSLLGKSTIEALADGLNNAAAIERYLLTGKVLPFEDSRTTNIKLDPSRLVYAAPVVPGTEGLFSEEQAKAEASRCLRCQCDACRRYLDLTKFYNKWPLRIKDEILATILPGNADLKAALAKRLINTSNLEGVCKEVCPAGIDLDGMILESRRSLHQQGKQPWFFHDFWIRDMDSANGPEAAVSRTPPGYVNSKYAFFPGCQLGATDSGYVLKTYEYLLQHEPDTAMLLNCCGAPAEWAGDEDKHRTVIDQIRKGWNELGRPQLILACPTCKQKLAEYLPDLPVVFLYDIMVEWGISPTTCWNGQTYSIFDPCSSRHEPELRNSIRKLVGQAGYNTEPLPHNESCPQCCSFGGQVSIANSQFAAAVITKRTAESGNPYIVYCINCRDIFRAAGKSTLHILDIVFGIRTEDAAPATVTERQQNRFDLKNTLLKEFWREEIVQEQTNAIKLIIGPELRKKLNADRIMESDIARVIIHCEKSGKRVRHRESGHYSGYKEIGHMTYWVTYRPLGNGYELVNAYCHRVKIDLEVVWNGKRTDIDL